MHHYFSSDFTLGILGGGQLGKMLLTETRKFDITTKVLDPSPDAPCRIACNTFVQGNLTDFNTVYNFGKDVEVLTIEIENVNVEALEKLQTEGVKVYPSPQTIKNIQNKATQKQFYVTHGIPTAPFQVFQNTESLKKAINEQQLTLPFVWKSARFGYDGNGVKIVRQLTDLNLLPNDQCIAESLVPFKKELAVIVARNAKGQVRTYPVVEMEFHPEANQVEYVLCPARIEEAVAQKARTIAIQVAQAFEVVGLLAVELFQTKNDEILVNEVAPRPHNSGHYSIEAAYTNQFEQHLRAILNLPLGSTESKVAGVMVNLVGAEGYQGKVVYENIEQIMAMEGVTPHIYGKKETRPFRKMGHVTIVNPNINKARQIAEQVKNTIRVIA
ncbi:MULTISPECIES: 5-(carboxyamino)imidazole ribonucleotide synthase [Capnocytophaga]|jgi:phosphoribosylaminoimidazole carboxylase, ATPase subunit|uniref:5-(carboxyamino)imidazole ribonucleotide synthase n=1 Tax=Capnocytophaga TaxID=1016 RepID=UPI0002A3A34E|nr:MULTISPECIES: 5-(carboxyamino)imidazole ribonucleotide synthase [Capnocytophaga]EKY04713.1 phosphoribosylaminoimidazole carboxylase, ATPase subunit [Capnocytophaga sp. oral taxon 380 str. F0488]